MGFLGIGGSSGNQAPPAYVPPPAPPAPPPAPPTAASTAVQAAGMQATQAARQAAGGGFSDTLKTGPMGAPEPKTTKATLGGG